MNRSESVANLGKALARAQAVLSGVKPDSKNPHFKSDYASLAAVNKVVLPLLTSNGIAVIQGVSSQDNRVGVSTTFIHGESGEWWTEELFLPVAKLDPQGFGSAITYGRRYLLMAMAGVALDDDDDGNEASNGQKQSSQPRVVVTVARQSEVDKLHSGYPNDWKAPADAQKWAVDNGHCKNEFEAKNSFKNSLKEVTGQDVKLDSNHLSAVLQNFYAKHVQRSAGELAVAA